MSNNDYIDKLCDDVCSKIAKQRIEYWHKNLPEQILGDKICNYFWPKSNPEEKEQAWNEYLVKLKTICDEQSDEENVDEFVFEVVSRIRSRLDKKVGFKMPVPVVCTSEDGGLVLAWYLKRAKLSIDVCISGEIEWFFKDFQSGNYVGGYFNASTLV
jgi:hypothetical protein